MKSFSERKGLKKVRTEMQVNSIDGALRTRLWNVLDYFYWKNRIRYSNDIEVDDRIYFTRLWHNYFKNPVDTLTFEWHSDLMKVRDYFFQCEWNEVYDIIEFTANAYPNESTNENFMKTCNEVLREEVSGYRFVNGRIAQITSEEEISEIEEALEIPLKSARTHIENALKLLSDRKSPDYRNSIKESISAVEAMCRLIANDEKATLGKALDMIETKSGLHGALKRAFDSLYGYTSSAEGIRHSLGLTEEPSLSFEDAKFMLVSCSAFVNYLVAKTAKQK
jgi:hypothetical protein